jgi:hypothetical protein
MTANFVFIGYGNNPTDNMRMGGSMDLQLSMADLAKLASHTYVNGASNPTPSGYDLITSRGDTDACYWGEVW